jgi:hypothetical protein
MSSTIPTMSADYGDLADVLEALDRFYGDRGLTERIATLEYLVRGVGAHEASEVLTTEGVVDDTLAGALAIKRLSGQINVVVHALGILLALPVILEEGEMVEEVSLGAGNTGRAFDLTTNRRVAEFKFINWRGADTIRQNTLFVDLYHLAEAETDKRRDLYVTDLVIPTRFLQGGRAIGSVLTKHGTVSAAFFERHGDRYRVVRDYWDDVKDRVNLVDITKLVPVIKGLPTD